MIGTVTIGTEATEILPHDNYREEIIIQNTTNALNLDGGTTAEPPQE